VPLARGRPRGAPALGDLDEQRRGVVALCLSDGRLAVLGAGRRAVPGFAFHDSAGFESDRR
jgi:hypothetical protein